VRLTGFEATVADWNSAHTASAYCQPGSCYNDDPNLPPSNGHEASDYFAVQANGGRITNYQMEFRPGTDQSQATTRALTEFPADVQVLWSVQKGSCSQMEVSSAAMSAALSNPSAKAFVEFTSDDDTQGQPSYSSTSVRTAFLGPMDYATPTDAGPC
jgi:hypothetical protein